MDSSNKTHPRRAIFLASDFHELSDGEIREARDFLNQMGADIYAIGNGQYLNTTAMKMIVGENATVTDSCRARTFDEWDLERGYLSKPEGNQILKLLEAV